MQRNLIVLLILFATVVASIARADRPVAGKLSLTRPTNRTEKHFDADSDGFLNPHERLLLRTHVLFHYPLVHKKSQLPYDVNENRMLEPFEREQYLADKRSGRFKAVYAKYKADLKKQKRRDKDRREYVDDMNEILRLEK